MGEYCDMKNCRRKFLLRYFDEELKEDCGHCDNCDTEYEKIDGTIIAQKALSAVVRTGQRFGLSYVIDFLRGSKSQKIKESHKLIKTYGVGADISKDEWFAYCKDLIAQGFLRQKEGKYPILELTETSMEVLKGGREVKLFKLTETKEKKASLVPEIAHPYIEELLNLLKKRRASIARKEDVPPYIIFSDATLVEFSTYLPKSETEMLKISGVGDLKMRKYGPDFLSEIIAYCDKHDLDSRIRLKAPKRKTRTKRNSRGEDTYAISLRMFLSGVSVSAIAAERGLTTGTIENHLVRFIPSGEIRVSDLVKPEKIETIRRTVLAMKMENGLTPIKEALGEEFTYGEIRAVVAEIM
jgi:ATP-dependent DNA helicase RecQ